MWWQMCNERCVDVENAQKVTGETSNAVHHRMLSDLQSGVKRDETTKTDSHPLKSNVLIFLLHALRHKTN